MLIVVGRTDHLGVGHLDDPDHVASLGVDCGCLIADGIDRGCGLVLVEGCGHGRYDEGAQ
jgi:hypothetical protein